VGHWGSSSFPITMWRGRLQSACTAQCLKVSPAAVVVRGEVQAEVWVPMPAMSSWLSCVEASRGVGVGGWMQWVRQKVQKQTEWTRQATLAPISTATHREALSKGQCGRKGLGMASIER
jgi:hypothetical protein